MKSFKSYAVVIFVAVGLLSGCGMGTMDPLLFDDQGNLRSTVHRDEIDEAGLESCNELQDDFEAEEDIVRVPVSGQEGEPVLIGVGGLALCIDEGDDNEGDEDEGLDNITVDGRSGPTNDTPVGLEDDAPPDQLPGGEMTHRPALLRDPTPEPATND